MQIGVSVRRIDQAAREAQPPTDSQKDAGNYKKGHLRLHGLDISIENPKGSMRSGTDRNGRHWSSRMTAHYGYIRSSVSADDEQLDVFIGPHPESERVFVVNQIHPDTGRFDEHKAILGTTSEQEARKLYLSNYMKGWKGFGSIKGKNIEEFKDWLKNGNTTRPMEKSRAWAGILLKSIRALPLLPSKKNPAVRRHQGTLSPWKPWEEVQRKVTEGRAEIARLKQEYLDAKLRAETEPILEKLQKIGLLPEQIKELKAVKMRRWRERIDEAIKKKDEQLKEFLDKHEGKPFYYKDGAVTWVLHPSPKTPGKFQATYFRTHDGELIPYGDSQGTYKDLIGELQTYDNLTLDKVTFLKSAAVELLFKSLGERQKADYERESALIRENKKKPEANQRHKFKRAKYLFPNLHPRCLICGDEETTTGYCNSSEEKYRAAMPMVVAKSSFHLPIVIAPTLIKSIITTPHLPGSSKVDWGAVPVGSSIWITVTDPSSPLHGRPILITKRPDDQAVIDPGEARRHGYKVGSWANEAFSGMRGMAHATFQWGKLHEQQKDKERWEEYENRQKEREPYEKRLHEVRTESSRQVRDMEQKFLESVGISKFGLTQLEKNTVRDSAIRQALNEGMEGDLANEYGKTVAKVKDQIEKRFQRDVALRRFKYYQRVLDKFSEQEKKKPDETEVQTKNEVVAADSEAEAQAMQADTAETPREETTEPSMGEETFATERPSMADAAEAFDPDMQAIGQLAARESEPIEMDPPAPPLNASTPQEVENDVTEQMLKNLAIARKRREEYEGIREEARKDMVLIRATQEGEDPLDKILRTQDYDATKAAVNAFHGLQQARAEKTEIMKIIPSKLPKPETVAPTAIENMRLKAIEAVDEEKVKEAERRYRDQSKMNLDDSFYAVVHEHWNDQDGYLLNGGVQNGATQYLNGLLKRKKGFVSGAAAAALTGLVGKHTGIELDVGRLSNSFSPEVTASIVGYWLVGLARQRKLKDKSISGIVQAIEDSNADEESGLLAMENKALATDKRLKESYQKIQQQKSNGELAAEATIMRMEAENILQRRENIGRAFGSLVVSGTMLMAMKQAQKGIDERLSINLGSSKENAHRILAEIGVKGGKNLPQELKITYNVGTGEYQITGNASYLANRFGKSQPLVNKEMQEIEKIKSNSASVVPTQNPPHFKKLWIDDTGQERDFLLRQSQRNDIDYLRKMGGGLITRSTGAGKTLTGLGYISHLLKENPKSKHVVICPDGLVDQWVDQGTRATSMKLTKIPEKQTKEARAKIWSQIGEGSTVIVSHSDALKAQSDVDAIINAGFDSAIIDEPQNLKSQASAKLGTAAKRIINIPFKHRVGLSATPARESMDEIYDWVNWATKDLKGFDKRGRAMWTPKIGSKVGFGRMYAGAGAGTNAQDEAIKAMIYQKLGPYMSGDEFKARPNYQVLRNTHQMKRTNAQIDKQGAIEKGFAGLKNKIETEEKAKAKKSGKGHFYVQQRVNQRLSKEMNTRHWNNLHGGEDNGKTKSVMDTLKKHIKEGRKTHIIYVDSDAQRVSIGGALRKAKMKNIYDLTELHKKAKFRGDAEKIMAKEKGLSLEQGVARVVEQRKAGWGAHKGKNEPSFIFIDRTSQAGHNLQKADSLSIAGRPQDAAALFQIIGRGDRSPREGDLHVDLHKYSDSPWEDNHWENIENQIKVVEAITPALTKAILAGLLIGAMAKSIMGARIARMFGLRRSRENVVLSNM